MSLKRERPDSSTEGTDIKKRSAEPSKEEFTFAEDAPFPINNLYTICKDCKDVDSPISSLFPEYCIHLLAAEILKNSKYDEVFGLVLECVKHLLEFLGDSFKISDQFANEFYSMVQKVWANQHFAQCLRATIEKNNDPILFILAYANQDPPALRMKRMEADPCFIPCLMGITSATHKTILRVFFSVLFSHWSEKSELEGLDTRMRKEFFRQRMALISKYTFTDDDIEMLDDDDEVDVFVHEIEEASQAKDMEPFRQWLVSKYGTCENIDAILEKAKTDIAKNLDTYQKAVHSRCDGKKARIKIMMTNGEYTGLFLQLKPL